MNRKIKQLQLIDYMKMNKIDILLLQEHNIRYKNKLCNEILDLYHVTINLSIAQKGGTAIIINKKLPVKIINQELSADSRITSIKIRLYSQILKIINIYAPSGSDNRERDEIFQNDLLFYLRNYINNTILAGDWNCITLNRDSESRNMQISKTLKNLITQIQFKDAWISKKNNIEYTYVRNNYGSRLDRIYVKEIVNYITDINVKNVSFSDHSSVIMNLEIPNIPKIGRYYWKLNVELLERDDIKEKFKDEWQKMKCVINKYDSINTWWDMYAKKQIRSFFTEIGKQEYQMKQGLLYYLEFKLNRIYEKLNKTGEINYAELKEIKDRINMIKTQMLEGVKIRNRMQEQTDGEKISAYLIGKQAKIKAKEAITSIKVEENIIENLNSGIIIKKKDTIEWYISKYYEKLYKRDKYDEDLQKWFIQFIDKKISNEDKQKLESNISNKEILNAINLMNTNKSPSFDGIPIEFYSKYWEIISIEISTIIRNIITGTELKEYQRRAIITLIPKEGDLQLLKSWRPISLISTDIKIVAKILANRIKPIMPDIISETQYCVNGKSIVDCNNKMRDILYYVNTHNIDGALVNLDWEKAFDRVDWSFLIKVMEKFGFPEFTIKWLMNLYSNITSSVLINGYVTKEFKIERGVRQGCPMSMLVYVLFQEPLYLAFKKCNKILPIEIQNEKIKNLGYADDTTAFAKDDNSFKEIFRLIKKFEKASNSKINIRKTKIFGFGNWNGRIMWPISGLKIEIDYCCMLGIIFSNDHKKAVDRTWNQIIEKIRRRIQMITGRNLNLYQKVIIINSLISSKIWYTAHTYPLPMKYSILINQEICKFIWNNKKVNRVKREVICKEKNQGGLGLLDIYHKARSIFVNTTIKNFLYAKENNIMKYYIENKVNQIFGIQSVQNKNKNKSATYYEYAIDLIKKCKNIKDFPKMKSKMIYEKLKPDIKATIEINYPNYDWNEIWKNVNFRFLNINDRPIIYKYCHGIITTNKRLHQIRIRNDSLCEHCQIEDSIIHRFYHCQTVRESLSWLKKAISYLCGINYNDLSRIIFLELPKIDIRSKNTLCIIICSFIACVWFERNNLEQLIYTLKAKIIKDQKLNLMILKQKAKKIFSENYINSNIEFIYSL